MTSLEKWVQISKEYESNISWKRIYFSKYIKNIFFKLAKNSLPPNKRERILYTFSYNSMLFMFHRIIDDVFMLEIVVADNLCACTWKLSLVAQNSDSVQWLENNWTMQLPCSHFTSWSLMSPQITILKITDHVLIWMMRILSFGGHRAMYFWYSSSIQFLR